MKLLHSLKIFTGSNPPPPLNYCIHSLNIFNKGSNPPPPFSWKHYTHWKGSTRKFGKRVFEDPYSTRKSQSHVRSQTKRYQYTLIQSFCTGITTVFALRQDVMNCIPGKRRLQALQFLYFMVMSNVFLNKGMKPTTIWGYHVRAKLGHYGDVILNRSCRLVWNFTNKKWI